MMVLFKDRIVNIIAKHPNLMIFGIGLTIMFVIGIALGSLGIHQVHANSHDIMGSALTNHNGITGISADIVNHRVFQ